MLNPFDSTLQWGLYPYLSPYDLSLTYLSPQTAEQMHAWVSRYSPEGPKPPVIRPFNYVRAVVITTIILGFISAFSVAAPYIMPVIQNRNLWAAISLIIILLFTSGHMFNHIRKVPYVTGDGKGSVTYFVGGFSNQLGLETQIVAAMCEYSLPGSSGRRDADRGADGILSFATIALALKVPRMTNAKQQQAAVFMWSAVIYGMYGFLLRVFHIKNGGYPFHLPPL
jgi:oligosaccharyltransferase complex subunit gamma